MNMLARRLLVGSLVLAPLAMFAQTTPVADAQAIVTTATTLFGLVAALVVSVVAFFTIVKIVKWIRK